MARRIKRRKKIRNIKKINNQNIINHKIIYSLIFEIILGLGLFNLGIVGNFLANLYKLMIGNYFGIFVSLTMFFIIFRLFFRKFSKYQKNFWVAILLFSVPFLVLTSLLFKINLHINDNIFSYFWTTIWGNIKNNRLSGNLGGGIIGTLIYVPVSKLISDIGVWIICLLCFTIGFLKFFNKSSLGVCLATVRYISKKVNSIRNHNLNKKEASNSKQNYLKKFFAKFANNGKKNLNKNLNENKTREEHNFPEIKWNKINDDSNGKESNFKINASLGKIKGTSNENKLLDPNKNNYIGGTDHLQEKSNKQVTNTKGNDDSNYKFPSFSLLSKVKSVDQTKEYKQLAGKSKIVRDTLKSFHIDTDVSSVNLGPSITQYQLKPARGVKISTIASRADDLALALSAKSIRVEAPIPGKPFVGVEVPNKVQATVSFSDIISHSRFEPKYPLRVPLGRNVSNEVISADLASMPHLLIAGATGSGKSVAINGIISSLLMRLKPNRVKFMMIDPKKVELSMYNGLPHLLAPVVSEPRKAARSLQKIVKEMEKRYELFAKNGVRNIDGWNGKIENSGPFNDSENKVNSKMPYIIIVVDELADLMMTAKSDVETSIVRIAQMGRAAGVHLILATQRPSVDVITGLIKANVPSRIAFAVSSGIDSRTILDKNGAEKLLGKGDMLFSPAGKEMVRIQGAFIPDIDVEKITDFIREESSAEYDSDMLVSDKDISDNEDNGQPVDKLFGEASNFVWKQRKASTSMLQRRFRIGYNRAARIIDELENAGIVGPQDGSRPREVFSPKKNDDNDKEKGLS